jgi:hypothetical protein
MNLVAGRQRRINGSLKQHGFKPDGQNKHKKFRNHEGRTITISCTPSDVNAEHAQMRDLERILKTPVSPVRAPDRKREAAIILKPQPKKKISTGGNGNSTGNNKLVSYEKIKVKVSEEQRAADRLNSEWVRMLDNTKRTVRLTEQRINECLAYAYSLLQFRFRRKLIARKYHENCAKMSREQHCEVIAKFKRNMPGRVRAAIRKRDFSFEDPLGRLHCTLFCSESCDCKAKVRYGGEKDLHEVEKDWLDWSIEDCFKFFPLSEVPSWLRPLVHCSKLSPSFRRYMGLMQPPWDQSSK